MGFCTGTRFKRLIPDNSCENGGEVVRVIFCSGKVYYELAKEREKLGLLHKVAIARMEQVGVAIWAGLVMTCLPTDIAISL